jgi:DNA repair protein RadD
MLPELWPPQCRAIEGVLDLHAQGVRRVLVTAPTGAGKTRVECELLDRWITENQTVAVVTNRKSLLDQTSRVLDAHGIDHGKRAAGWSDVGKVLPVQLISLQTENSRVWRTKKWESFKPTRAIFDEPHMMRGEMCERVMKAVLDHGGCYAGFTATPLDLAAYYDHLLIAGTSSECRACGALVPALHYGCDEPDLRHIGRVEVGKDLTEAQNRSAIMRHGIFGRVLEWYKRLNPEMRPTILFAPGVRESIWFCDQFNAAGISAAHIDGECVYVKGEVQRSSRSARADVLAGSKSGSIRVVCNRFVLREGIDAPWLAHGVLATVFGSLQGYLQSGGRLLRAFPGLEFVTIQDHGGNWHRHGSLNADREWSLNLTSAMVSGMREERLRSKKEREPCRCPECGLILAFLKCKCGYVVEPHKKPPREVVQADGTLKQMHGDIYRPRRISRNPNGSEIWKKMYFRSKTGKGRRTFRAAMALFAVENNWLWPAPTWPLMPKDPEVDMWRQVADVPIERLH